MRPRYCDVRLCISHLEVHEFAYEFSLASIYAPRFTSNDLEKACCFHLYTFPFGAVKVRELRVGRSFVSRVSSKQLLDDSLRRPTRPRQPVRDVSPVAQVCYTTLPPPMLVHCDNLPLPIAYCSLPPPKPERGRDVVEAFPGSTVDDIRVHWVVL